MSDKCNNQGRAYEYVIISGLCEYIKQYRPVHVVHNSSLDAAKKAYDGISKELRNILQLSAEAAIEKLYDLEPLIFEDEDELELLIQKDSRGECGDVRDILIIRSHIGWEIGLSIKHNHFAVKHSRLSTTIDFGEKWYGVKCSDTYWTEVNAIFDSLNPYIKQGKEWKQVSKKEDEIYLPILNVFMKEFQRAIAEDKKVCGKFAEYMLGSKDFYKIISRDVQRITEIQGYNFQGQLNHAGKRKASITVPLVKLPDEIYHMGFKKNSKTTIEIAMNNGWSFSLRIHNAEREVKKTLKFDIQFIGVPVVLTLDCAWKS